MRITTKAIVRTIVITTIKITDTTKKVIYGTIIIVRITNRVNGVTKIAISTTIDIAISTSPYGVIRIATRTIIRTIVITMCITKVVIRTIVRTVKVTMCITSPSQHTSFTKISPKIQHFLNLFLDLLSIYPNNN